MSFITVWFWTSILAKSTQISSLNRPLHLHLLLTWVTLSFGGSIYTLIPNTSLDDPNHSVLEVSSRWHLRIHITVKTDVIFLWSNFIRLVPLFASRLRKCVLHPTQLDCPKVVFIGVILNETSRFKKKNLRETVAQLDKNVFGPTKRKLFPS